MTIEGCLIGERPSFLAVTTTLGLESDAVWPGDENDFVNNKSS